MGALNSRSIFLLCWVNGREKGHPRSLCFHDRGRRGALSCAGVRSLSSVQISTSACVSVNVCRYVRVNVHVHLSQRTWLELQTIYLPMIYRLGEALWCASGRRQLEMYTWLSIYISVTVCLFVSVRIALSPYVCCISHQCHVSRTKWPTNTIDCRTLDGAKCWQCNTKMVIQSKMAALVTRSNESSHFEKTTQSWNIDTELIEICFKIIQKPIKILQGILRRPRLIELSKTTAQIQITPSPKLDISAT